MMNIRIAIIFSIFYSCASFANLVAEVNQTGTGLNQETTIVFQGSIDLTGLTPVPDKNMGPYDRPYSFLGGDGSSGGGIVNMPWPGTLIAYVGIGSTNLSTITSATQAFPLSTGGGISEPGGALGINNQFIYVDSNYQSGASISFNMAFTGKSISDLGFTPGTQSWNFGNNVFTFIVHSPPVNLCGPVQ